MSKKAKKVKKVSPKQKIAKNRIEKTVDATKTLLKIADTGEKVLGSVRKFVLPVALVAFVTWAYAALDVEPEKE